MVATNIIGKIFLKNNNLVLENLDVMNEEELRRAIESINCPKKHKQVLFSGLYNSPELYDKLIKLKNLRKKVKEIASQEGGLIEEIILLNLDDPIIYTDLKFKYDSFKLLLLKKQHQQILKNLEQKKRKIMIYYSKIYHEIFEDYDLGFEEEDE